MSERYTLNKEDFKKSLKNTLVFAAPALIVFLTMIQQGKTVKEAAYALYLFGLNVIVDLLKKYVENK